MATSRPSDARRAGLLAFAAAAFGAVTVFAAGSVLFGPAAAVAGATVPFVLWTNLVLGFAYIAGAVLLLRQSPWARPVALAIAGITAVAAIGFVVVATRGTAVEPRTAAALTFRVAFWLVVAWLAPRGRA